MTKIILTLLAAVSLAAPAAVKEPKELKAGKYTAKVAMLSCGACGPNVEQALGNLKGIETAKVDSDKSLVTFTVKKDAKVKVADVQKTLKASADKMGMGADYSLSKIQSLKS